MGKVSKRRKVFPYFKVLTRDPRNFCWMDARKEAFDTLEEAKKFIEENLEGMAHRIDIVEGERDRRIFEE